MYDLEPSLKLLKNRNESLQRRTADLSRSLKNIKSLCFSDFDDEERQ